MEIKDADDFDIAQKISEELKEIAERNPGLISKDRMTLLYGAGYLMGQALLVRRLEEETKLLKAGPN